MNAPVAELDGVSKRYGARVALRGVHLRLGRGESVGYLGPNGAGKTTTLRLLAGLARPDEGTVRLLGVDPRSRPTPLARVGTLIETPGTLPYVTGRDLLEYTAAAKGLRATDRRREVEEWSRRLGVWATLDEPLGTLSTGLGRRVLLAGALLGDPELLLLDEPTLGLDPAARIDLRAVLRELRGDGRTILLSSHLLEDVREVCDRVVFLRDGAIVGDEAVQLRHRGGDGTVLRAIAVRFEAPVDEDTVRRALLGTERVLRHDGSAADVLIEDSDRRQAEYLAALVRSGVPLLELAPREADLDARYLEAVGREESA